MTKQAVTEQERATVILETGLTISGQPIEIMVDNPFKPGEPWFMRQPSDMDYDMALAVRDAKQGQVLNDPDMSAAKTLPPSDEWIDTQQTAIASTKEKVAELESIEHPLPVDLTLLATFKDHLDSLVLPEEYTLAKEIASRTANRAFQNYLIPRLLVDATGKPYLDMTLKSDREKWDFALSRTVKLQLRFPFAQVLSIINTAKN